VNLAATDFQLGVEKTCFAVVNAVLDSLLSWTRYCLGLVTGQGGFERKKTRPPIARPPARVPVSGEEHEKAVAQ